MNQLRRGGVANAVLIAFIAAGAVLLSLSLFAIFLLIGLFGMTKASPGIVMLVWDGMVLGLLFLWCIGLLADLQRSESLSLEKFLHLPVSISGVFFINYISSLLSLNLLLFAPAATGLALGLVFSRGSLMLLLFPLLAAFLLMVTALTYQFQGWLASLMINKRRRRTVIVVVTMTFVLIFQLPNLFNLFGSHRGSRQETRPQVNAPNPGESQSDYEARIKEADRQLLRQVEQSVRFVNLIIPPGWLPLGVLGLAEGRVLPALLGTMVLTLLGAGSLWRAYRTTVRLYTGQFNSGKKSAVAAPPATPSDKESTALVEKELAWLSEHAAAIALSSLRSLLRAPEAKMILLSPILMIVIFGGMALREPFDMPQDARPLMAFGAMGMLLLTILQLVGNQFGFDRGGFRVFVLCPARRRDILLGKNLAVAPVALGLGFLLVCFVQITYPMRPEHFLAVIPQLLSMYLLYCLLANLLAIIAPMPIAAGSLKPANPRVIPVLLHVAFTLVLPLLLAPTLLPLGIEVLLEALQWVRGVPIYMFLSIVECVVVVYVYRLVVSLEGRFLQAREQKILEIVTSKGE
jgi:hypothetical protein